MATINGTPAGETLTGTESRDIIFGDRGGDTLLGLGGNDGLIGDFGADVLDGGSGDDTLEGGPGRDVLDGGDGDDAMYGGDDRDIYILRGPGAASSDDRIIEAADDGIDVLKIIGTAPSALSIWYSGSGYYFQLPGAGGTVANYFVDARKGTDGTDFWSRFGRIEFDDGTVWKPASGFVAFGLDLGQVTEGTPFHDTLDGQGGDDLLNGYGGDDLLIGGRGDDNIAGGEGSDTYVLRVGDGVIGARGQLIEGKDFLGTDTIRFEDIDPLDLRIWSDSDRSLALGLPDGSGGYGVQRVSLDFEDFWDLFERVEFASGQIWDEQKGLHAIGLEIGQRYTGSRFTDFVAGRGGDDQIWGKNGRDIIYGGSGHDEIYGGDRKDEIKGGTGDDYMDGGRGGDILRGGVGDDTIIGRGGGDFIDGGPGNDFLQGGFGGDYFSFRSRKGMSTVDDFIIIEGDKVDLSHHGKLNSLADVRLAADDTIHGLQIVLQSKAGVATGAVTFTGLTTADLTRMEFIFDA